MWMPCNRKTKEFATKHHMYKTRFYNIWAGMKRRCNDDKIRCYKNYKGKGITYDPRWEEFQNFYDDMYESYCKHVEEYGEKDTTLDRIDSDGNYYKENCRWATLIEQANNKTDSVYYDYDNKKLTLRQIYDNYYTGNLSFHNFQHRAENRDSIEEVLQCNQPLYKTFEYNNKQYRMRDLLPFCEEGITYSMLNHRLNDSNKYATSYSLIYNDNLFKLKCDYHEFSKLKIPIKEIDDNRKQEIINETNEQLKSIKFNYTSLK